MKAAILAVGIVLIQASTVFAQFSKGDVELSLSGSIGSWNVDTKETSASYGSTEYSTQTKFFFVSISPGYYLTDGLSIEPEISFMADQHDKPAQYVLLNLSYTYMREGYTTAPYVRLGYGLANSYAVPFANLVIGNVSDNFDVNVFNAGIGLKFILNPHVILRTEFNYRDQWWSHSYDDYGYSYSEDNTFSNYGLLVGFSVIL